MNGEDAVEIDEGAETQIRGGDKWAAKHDATTRAAKDIMAREKAAEDAKTEKLRAARVARDLDDGEV